MYTCSTDKGQGRTAFMTKPAYVYCTLIAVIETCDKLVITSKECKVRLFIIYNWTSIRKLLFDTRTSI